MSLTDTAFSAYRVTHQPPRPPNPERIRDPSECSLMTAADGLATWIDGPGQSPIGATPNLSDAQIAERRLWVVRLEDVVTAPEVCSFGTSVIQGGLVKHSNLTGGAEAYCGGEMIVLAEGAILINGFSGRYTPRSAVEMDDVAKAFKESGYAVWSMGYDDESNFPLPFGRTTPIWIA